MRKLKWLKGFMMLLLVASFIEAQKLPDVNVTMDFEGADIKTVLRAFAEIGDVNIVASPKVSGTITLHLKNVPWWEALRGILEANGYVVVVDSNILRVMALSEYQEQRRTKGMITKVFRVHYAKANKLEKVLSGMLSKGGALNVETRTNSIVVTDLPEVISEIDSMIKVLDKQTPQVRIKAKLVQVDYGAVKELGIVWSLSNLNDASTSTHTGVGFNAAPSASRGTFLLSKISSDWNLEASISALEDENKAEILSEPSILVTDNQEAMILSGKKIPIVTRDFAGNQIIQFYDVALKLKVTPHISPNGVIMLELHPEISDIAGEAPGAAGPVISSQEAITKLAVKSGETVVIGGILRTTDQSIRKGVPILSKIPIINTFFSFKSKERSKSELLIFVTPEIVSTNEGG